MPLGGSGRWGKTGVLGDWPSADVDTDTGGREHADGAPMISSGRSTQDTGIVLFESLESRQLLAATAQALESEPAAPFIAKVNFQPSGATVPAGYMADTGSRYGNRGNGFTYGWNVANNKWRDRNSSRSPDQRYDSLTHMPAAQIWQIAVPNGTYAVKLFAGDASHFDSYYRFNAENQLIVDYRPTTASRWGQGIVTVHVTDGNLTISSALGSSNNKLCFVEIYQQDALQTILIGSSSSGYSKSGPADLLLRPALSNPADVAMVEFFNGSTKIGEDATAPFGLSYTNVDIGTYAFRTPVTTTSGAVTELAPAPVTIKSPIIAWQNIGGSDTTVANRGVGWSIKTLGWQGYVNTYIKPQLDWDAKRIILSNPFGTLPDEQMQMDQYLHAQSAGLTWLTNGFTEAWKPIVDSGVEVIAYFGCMEADSDFNITNWQQRFWDSIAPALNAGMNIAMDAAVSGDANSKSIQAARLLRSRGVEVYIEARPSVGYTHWHDYNVISTDTWWDRSEPDRYTDAARWATPSSMLSGEIMRAVT